jgi:lipoprotein YgeR
MFESRQTKNMLGRPDMASGCQTRTARWKKGRAKQVFAILLTLFLYSGCSVPKYVRVWDYPASLFGRSGYHYEVQPGDTLLGISIKTGVPVKELVRANRLSDPDKLDVGQRLLIPGKGKSDSRSSTPVAGRSSSSRSTTQVARSGTGETTSRKKAKGSIRTVIPSSEKGLRWPLDPGFVITSKYGPRAGGFHRGIDLAAAEGTPVYAAADGVVTHSGSQTDQVGKLLGFGNYIFISHENGLITLYAHNRRNLVKKGQRIRKGQKIAEVGHTGTTRGPTGNHLHFEVRDGISAESLDPLKYLPPQ